MADALWRRALKRAGSSPALPRLAGHVAAAHMRFVRLTSRIVTEPASPFEVYRELAPFILTLWHGQQLMLGYLMRNDARLVALTSKSNDGELSATYLASFGIGIVRGSGGRNRRHTIEKGGIRGFLAMRRTLEEGTSVVSVADVPNTVRRQCGRGIVSLARASGRPVVPIGFATSRWMALNTWDRATIHMPFSRGACAVGRPILVPRDADDTMLEEKRLEVERELNAVTDRAYALVGKQRNWLE